MKVTVTLELDIRPDDWIAQYGIGLWAKSEIPPDQVATSVAHYVLNVVKRTPVAAATCNSVTLKGAGR